MSSAAPLFCRLFRWTLWLVLAAALSLQLRILSEGGLHLPSFATEYISRQLSAQGFTLQTEAIWLDPRGRVLILAPQLGLAAQDTPFASARAVSLQLRRRALLRGDIEAARIEIADLSVVLPAILSPTGAAQPVLTSGELRLSHHTESETWRLDQASARLLNIPVAFEGHLPELPDNTDRPAAPPSEITRSALRHCAEAYSVVAALPLDSIRVLRADLSPARLTLAAELPELVLPPHPALPARLTGTRLENTRLLLTLPFSSALQPDLARTALLVLSDRFASPADLATSGENLALRLVPGSIFSADLAASRIHKLDTHVPPAPLIASARYAPYGTTLSLDVSTRLAGAPWHVSVAGSSADLAGSVQATGPLTPALLDVIRHYLPAPARPILSLTDPIQLDITADFSPGARPALVTARIRAGRAVAHHVSFTRAGGVARYAPAENSLRVDDLLLVQEESHATGSYEMNTATLDYRFLLGGHLRPMAIEGWFSVWWDRFWANFAFGPRPPEAEVDIQGMWRAPSRTTVFIGAHSDALRLRDLPLDRFDTRIWVRTHFFDILHFRAAQGPHLATGDFTRLLNAPRDSWQRMEFDVHANFPAAALGQLFGKPGAEITAPFRLTSPPKIHLQGETLGPASTVAPGRQRYTLGLSTKDPLHYAGFPLDHLSVRLQRDDTDIRLHDLRVGFASGLATGEAVLSGPDSERWLAFDITLADADLDLAQTRWREFQATRPQPSPPPPASTTPPKNLGGRLALQLAATGPVNDPLAFTGTGTSFITGADLAQIRLMGRLSELLGNLGLGFTTVKLNEADARFTLDHDRLNFDPLTLSGQSAQITTKGTYTLSANTLAFTAKIRPFERSGGILSSTADFVLSPLSSALEIELGGTLNQPSWIFSYGPSRILRRITDRF